MTERTTEGTRRTAHDYTLSSVRSAARVLCAFTLAEPELGLSELARRLDLGKSRVHRLLATLVSERLVEQNPLTGKYRLSIKLYELGAIVSTHLDLHEAVAEYIDELRNRTGETVHVAVLDGDEVVYVERRESPNTLRLFTRIGHRNFAHCTSTGKVLLAHLPERELDRVLERTVLVAKTPYTITDAARLRTDLERVRRRGWAENVNESELGVASRAAPVRDAGGRVVAAISVAGPLPRFTPEAMRRMTNEVIATAERISARLGHRADAARLRAISGR
ncbi:MAG TPA: IclR family transcriptional regulator [Actinomycetes bacterium]|nr:IclR family transcriptional regulator [Actinomycetes bacterium]